MHGVQYSNVITNRFLHLPIYEVIFSFWALLPNIWTKLCMQVAVKPLKCNPLRGFAQNVENKFIITKNVEILSLFLSFYSLSLLFVFTNNITEIINIDSGWTTTDSAVMWQSMSCEMKSQKKTLLKEYLCKFLDTKFQHQWSVTNALFRFSWHTNMSKFKRDR